MTNTPTPSPEERNCANKWLALETVAYFTRQEVVGLLASYAAEQGRRKYAELPHPVTDDVLEPFECLIRKERGVIALESVQTVINVIRPRLAAMEERADAAEAAESRLTSLREGLRRYARHLPSCPGLGRGAAQIVSDCTCGLSELAR